MRGLVNYTRYYNYRFANILLLIIILIGLLFLMITPRSLIFDISNVKKKMLVVNWENDELNWIPEIDNSQNWSDVSFFEKVKIKMPDLPLDFWLKHKNDPAYFNRNCAKLPNIYWLDYSSPHWQTLRTPNGTAHIYGVFLDDRPMNKQGPTVRVLGMIDRVAKDLQHYCQMWFHDEKDPIMVNVTKYIYIWHDYWGNYRNGQNQPYLMTCLLPATHANKIPAAVSLVANPCDTATNFFTVVYEKPAVKKDIAVCTKHFIFNHVDLSVRLTEWLELLRLLGVDKVYMYELALHPNVSKIIKHYQNEGYLDMSISSVPGGRPSDANLLQLHLKNNIVPSWQTEVIPYNDCFYRNMYKYKYIILIDIDEIIAPTKLKTLQELVSLSNSPNKNPKNITWDSIVSRNAYYYDTLTDPDEKFEGIPNYMHILRHVYRLSAFNPPGSGVKSFYNTDSVLTLHNHMPFECFEGCHNYDIPVEDGFLRHYRVDHICENKKCNRSQLNITKDTSIWRYKNNLTNKVTDTLKEMGFFSKYL